MKIKGNKAADKVAKETIRIPGVAKIHFPTQTTTQELGGMGYKLRIANGVENQYY